MTPSRTPIGRELLAGLAGATGAVPVNIANGAIALSPLGPEGVVAGAASAMVAAGVTGLVMGAMAGSRPMASATSAAVALTIASFLSAGIAAGALPAGSAGIGPAVVAIALVAVLSGLVVGLFALLRLGRIAAFVPYPVLSGFLNGTAVLLLISQIGPLLGRPLGTVPALSDIRPLAALVVAVGLAAMMFRPPGLLAGIPGVLRALIAAVLVDGALRLAGLGAWLGPVLGAPPTLEGHVADMAAGIAALPGLSLGPLVPHLLLAVATVSVLIVLETLGSAAALREFGQPRADLDRDLRAVAVANVAAGAAGGLPANGSVVATALCFAAGGRERLSALSRGVGVLAALATLGPAVALIPQAALTAVVLGTAWTLVDAGTLRPLRAGAARRRATDAGVMLTVAAVAVIWSLAAAVAIGLALAALAFTVSMARGVIRASWRNPVGRSRTRRPAAAEAILLASGDRIEVVELEGALFFGTAESVTLHVDASVQAGVTCVILDMARVTRVDLSGGRQVLRLLQRPPAGLRVMLAGLRPGTPAHDDLEALGLRLSLPGGTAHETLESALETAEDRLLADEGHPATMAATAPLDALRQLGLEEGIAARLLAHMEEQRFLADALVIRRGDPAEGLYVLLAGTAEITIPRAEGGSLRVATLAPGAIFGEMAVLTGAPRSADVRARTPLRCLRLGTDTLAALERAEPSVAAALLRAIARQIDSNLRLANSTIASLQR